MWQAGPAGRTRSRIASPSQSSRISSTASVLPEVAPLCQSSAATAAPEPRLAGLARAPERLLVHPGQHQHAAVVRVLDDRGAAQPSGSAIPPPSARASARAAAPGARGRSTRRSAASAPASNASARCRAQPAPPDAITGTVTAVGDRAGQLEVVAVARAVGVDRGEQHLARAAARPPPRPSRPRRCRAGCGPRA